MSRQENISKSFCFLWEDIPSVQIYPVFTFAQEERRKEAQDFSHCFLFFCLWTLKKNSPQKNLPLKRRNRGEGNIQTCQLFLPLFGVLGGGKKKGGIEASPENFLHPFCGARASFSPIIFVCFLPCCCFGEGQEGLEGRARLPGVGRCGYLQFWGIFAVFGGARWEGTQWEIWFILFPAGNWIFILFPEEKDNLSSKGREGNHRWIWRKTQRTGEFPGGSFWGFVDAETPKLASGLFSFPTLGNYHWPTRHGLETTDWAS